MEEILARIDWLALALLVLGIFVAWGLPPIVRGRIVEDQREKVTLIIKLIGFALVTAGFILQVVI